MKIWDHSGFVITLYVSNRSDSEHVLCMFIVSGNPRLSGEPQAKEPIEPPQRSVSHSPSTSSLSGEAMLQNHILFKNVFACYVRCLVCQQFTCCLTIC